MIQVSVVVATYNSDVTKLRRTLEVITAQTGVTFEIIITDDGSTQKDFSWLPDFFGEKKVADYQIIENEVNLGTVNNLLSGIRQATGEYVFVTSPGDFLYDNNTLCDFYRFAEEHGAKICFGNAVYYTVGEDVPTVTRTYGSPQHPEVHIPGRSAAVSAANFFGGDYVVGAAYFREREAAQTYLEQISNVCRYLEDTSSTAFAIADGVPLCYYDRNIVWYEDGTGVSTAKESKWAMLLREDLLGAFKKLKQKYPKDPFVDIGYCNLSQMNRVQRVLRKLLRHPILMLYILFYKHLCRAKQIAYTPEDLRRLQAMISRTV